MDSDAYNPSSMLPPEVSTETVGNQPTTATEKVSVESIKKGGVSTPFPYKLHIMLNNMDAEAAKGDLRGKSIVGWQPHGRAFRVHKKDEFVGRVMPHFFNGSKYSSFVRQLNLYGFIRITVGQDKGAVYHPYFVRSQTHMVKKIFRRRIKGTKIRKPVDTDNQPNFYANADLRAIAAIDIAFDLAFARNAFQQEDEEKDETNNNLLPIQDRDYSRGHQQLQGSANPNQPLNFH